jgi:hypothetical protein
MNGDDIWGTVKILVFLLEITLSGHFFSADSTCDKTLSRFRGLGNRKQ